MARTARKSAAPTKPLLKPPVRIGNLDTAALVGELRQLHEDAEDESVGQMPADEELFGALLHLEANAGALKGEEARRKAAIARVKLWEYLREQADVHQAKAVEDARHANAEWAQLVPALAVRTVSAAYNKATRLRAAALTDDSRGVDSPVRRTPEAVLDVERRAALREAEARRVEQEAAHRHRLLAPVAQRLIEHRAGLDDGGEVTDWLDEIATVLPDCNTPIRVVSLQTYVAAAVRELRKIERTTARPAASTPDAQLAYEAAAELIDG
ncbi:hypothetical protein [Streptomyces sp. TLI_185]|uniref:hypothetical protein n=1 Tax=Streptomyces sp. TLI_185 TaxID=2485151 RepID=UPI000F50FCFB|nr:hypothetical protein [Streptomyces sp. TLI_185]RPF24759.1 hypothetical protein EDD92_9700 [Streptomyces sp. TLI_185]